jgi:hypothetical protein
MENLAQEIAEDLTQTSAEDTLKTFSAFEKMSLANLQKQDKKLLTQFCEDRKLIKDLTDRQKDRLTRKELAQLIKGLNSSATKQKEAPQSEQSENILQTYQMAVMGAINGNYDLLDTLALKNVNGFIYSGLSDTEMTEETEKRIKLIGFITSSFYLLVKFTGGVQKWKEGGIKLFKILKEKVKK